MLRSTKEKNHKAAVSLPQFHPLWINYQGVVPRRLVHGSSPCQIMAPRVWDSSCLQHHLQMYVGPYNTIINDVLSRIGCWRWCSPHGVHVHVQIGQESVSQDLGDHGWNFNLLLFRKVKLYAELIIRRATIQTEEEEDAMNLYKKKNVWVDG